MGAFFLQPQTHPLLLQGLLHRHQEMGRDLFQLYLVPHCLRRGLHHLLSAVLLAIEAPVDQALYTRPQRVKQDSLRQGGENHRLDRVSKSASNLSIMYFSPFLTFSTLMPFLISDSARPLFDIGGATIVFCASA